MVAAFDLEARLAGGSESGSPFARLLLAVFNSILEVFLLCLAGYILARHGILDKKTQKQINRLNVSLFTPALLFSKVAFYLTPEKLKELWIIPIWFVIVTTASMTLGKVLGWAFGLRQSQRSFVMAAAMFMNSNALPIALMQSLVVSVPDLAWGSDDNKNAMLGRALTYLTMYSTLGMIVRYSYGVSLLSRADTILIPPTLPSTTARGTEDRTSLLVDIDGGADSQHVSSPVRHETLNSRPSASTLAELPSGKSFHSSPSSSLAHSRASSPKPPFRQSGQRIASPNPDTRVLPASSSPVRDIANGTGNSEQLLRPGPRRRATTFYNSFPNTPNASQIALPTWDDESPDTSADEDEILGNGTVRLPGPERDIESGVANGTSSTAYVGLQGQYTDHVGHQHTFMQKFTKRVSRYWVAFNNFMTVPLWAALLSLLVACLDPLKHALEHHIQPLNEAINTCGKCAVPLTLVVLGAYFYVPPPEGDAKMEVQRAKEARKAKKRPLLRRIKDMFRSKHVNASASKEVPRPKETLTVALAVATRMIITPALLIPLILWATTEDWHAVFEDPVFVVVNTILLCSPPALTLAQITAAVSGDAFERLISRTIFWSYCIVTPPVTIGCVLLGLWLAKI